MNFFCLCYCLQSYYSIRESYRLLELYTHKGTLSYEGYVIQQNDKCRNHGYYFLNFLSNGQGEGAEGGFPRPVVLRIIWIDS